MFPIRRSEFSVPAKVIRLDLIIALICGSLGFSRLGSSALAPILIASSLVLIGHAIYLWRKATHKA